jgi:hypothetical protein
MTYLEVLYGGEARMLMCEDGPYNYGSSFDAKMGLLGCRANIEKVKIWSSGLSKFPIWREVCDSGRADLHDPE